MRRLTPTIRPWAVAVLLCGILAFLPVAGARAGGDAPTPSGLLWNRSGLPGVFPLQVKTPPGQDYYLTLVPDGSEDAALAAFIVGGTFFKVLVPPGTFVLHFATGQDWQGEGDLFGPGADTERFQLREPLTFEVRGAATKAGHVVDLTGPEATVKGQFICQTVETDFGLSPQERERRRRVRPGGAIPPLGEDLFADEADGVERHLDWWDNNPRYPKYGVRSRYCE